MAAPPHRFLPSRGLPITYFASAHLCLLGALLTLALAPERVGSFFFHPAMFAVVHTITLGWLTASILGATYIVGPLTLRMELRARAVDWCVCAGVLIGASGVIAHFWLGSGSYSGVAWSGAMMDVAFLVIGVRVVRALMRAGGPVAVRWHIGLAYGNLVLAALFGALLAVNKNKTILPGTHLTDVFGHAHLALVGWVTMMVMGAGYRLLPMYLPAAPPKGARVWASAVLVEIGVLGLSVAFLVGPPLVPVCSLLIVAGLLVFLCNVVGMLRDRRPAAKARKGADLGMLHALQALLYLLLSVGVGLYLVFAESLELGWIMAYGVFVLIGFLSQIVIGIGMRLFPMFAWTEAWAGSGYKTLPPSPFAMPARPLQVLSLLAWTAGVPTLAYGLAHTRYGWVTTGAWLLFVGAVVATANAAVVLRHALRPHG